MIQYNTPILLITFNRPEHTRKVLERILSQSPKDLYIFQDGPRPGNEQDLLKCQKVRDVITSLTDGTTAHISTFFSEKNLGCGPGPYAAISWFFHNVDRGIILEDDIIPHPIFFSFMDDLLNRYSDDERIGAVMVYRHNAGSESNQYTNLALIYNNLKMILEKTKSLYPPECVSVFDETIDYYQALIKKIEKNQRYTWLRYFDWRFYKRIIFNYFKIERVNK